MLKFFSGIDSMFSKKGLKITNNEFIQRLNSLGFDPVDEYINSYNFNKHIEPVVKMIDELYQNDYSGYIERKASSKAPTPKGGKSVASKKVKPEGNVTFDDIFAM